MSELQEIKDEVALVITRLGNVEGYFNNFDTTLNNHMESYKVEQTQMRADVSDVRSKLTWGFWVIFGLLTTVLAGFVAGAVLLLDAYLRLLLGG